MTVDSELAAALARIATAFERLTDVADRYRQQQADSQGEVRRMLDTLEQRNQLSMPTARPASPQ